MREIPLSRGLCAMVDDEDYDQLVAVGKWHAAPGAHTFYGRKNFYHRGTGTFSYLLMHHAITGWPYVDHRNGNGLDNQRANLRPATHNQNMGNKGLYVNNTSGFKGVHRQGRKWIATCKKQYLGYFDSPEAAARAYDAAARELFGEFARPNFPEETSA